MSDCHPSLQLNGQHHYITTSCSASVCYPSGMTGLKKNQERRNSDYVLVCVCVCVCVRVCVCVSVSEYFASSVMMVGLSVVVTVLVLQDDPRIQVSGCRESGETLRHGV